MIINGSQPKSEDQLPTKINAYQQASSPIVDLDESGLAQDMPRKHGYSKKGTPCYGTQDWQAKERVNVMTIKAPMIFTRSLACLMAVLTGMFLCLAGPGVRIY